MTTEEAIRLATKVGDAFRARPETIAAYADRFATLTDGSALDLAVGNLIEACTSIPTIARCFEEYRAIQAEYAPKNITKFVQRDDGIDWEWRKSVTEQLFAGHLRSDR